MLLEVKKYSSKEIAEWMGISPHHFYKYRASKLEELCIYCKYEEVGKKINVLEVYDAEYNKKKYANLKRTLDAMRDLWGSGDNKWGLDRDTEVAKKINMQKEERDITVKETTLRVYVGKNRREHTNWEWKLAKYVVDPLTGIKTYYDFTDEEKKKKSTIWKDLFIGKDVEWVNEQRTLNKEAYEKGEVTKEEYADRSLFIEERLMSIWEEYKRRVADMCGCSVERCACIKEEKAW